MILIKSVLCPLVVSISKYIFTCTHGSNDVNQEEKRNYLTVAKIETSLECSQQPYERLKKILSIKVSY